MMMMQWWRCCSMYVFLLLFLLVPGVSQALELKLDGGMPVSQQAISIHALESSNDQAVVQTANEETTFVSGWLLLLLVVPLLAWLGWFLGHHKNQRLNRKQQLDMSVISLESVEKPVLAHERKRKEQEAHKLQEEKTVRSCEFSVIDLSVAYEHHHAGRQKEMLDVIGNAFKYDPFDLHVYIVSMTILSEIETPPKELIRLVRSGLFLLRTKRPLLWYEVAEKGRFLLPDLEDWSWKYQ